MCSVARIIWYERRLTVCTQFTFYIYELYKFKSLLFVIISGRRQWRRYYSRWLIVKTNACVFDSAAENYSNGFDAKEDRVFWITFSASGLGTWREGSEQGKKRLHLFISLVLMQWIYCCVYPAVSRRVTIHRQWLCFSVNRAQMSLWIASTEDSMVCIVCAWSTLSKILELKCIQEVSVGFLIDTYRFVERSRS